MIKIRLHIAKSKIIYTNPRVDDFSNLVKAVGMSAFDPCAKAAQNEQVTVYQFVEERGQKKSAIISWVSEDRGRENDQSFVTPLSCGPQSRSPYQLGLVSFLRWMRPFPSDPT